MLVFTPQYLDVLRQRWASRSERDWPLAVRVALLDYRDDDRAWIEESMEYLHEEDQERMVRNLRTQKQFVSSRGELMVGRLFLNAGYPVRYESVFTTAAGNRTPDWYANPPGFVCDVFTAGLQENRDADETSVREIEARLSDIAAPYVLLLEIENAATLDAGDRKDLIAATMRWLGTRPCAGDQTRIKSALLTVMRIGGERVDVITLDSVHIIQTPSSLAKNFEEKAKRYGGLGLPLVVAAVKHHRAEIHVSQVEDVLLGTRGVFASRAAISAVIWIEPSKFPPRVRVLANPIADLPLSSDVLMHLRSATL